MNKSLLSVLVGLDIVANVCVYLIFEDYEALLICLLKCIGAHGVITGEVLSIIIYVFLSCITTVTRTIQFLEVFRVYILFLNIYSTIMCFILLKNIGDDSVKSIDGGL